MSKATHCWHCQELLDDAAIIFCGHCHTLQPSGACDHFSRMGFPKRYDIGTHALEQAYFDRQRLVHPDRFATKSDKERRYAMEHTMAVNEAYATLSSPLLRAEYLLSLQGIVVMGDEANVKPDQMLLVETMESREALASASDAQALRQIEVHTVEERVKTIEAIRQALSDTQWDVAAQQTIRLRYLEKLIEEIKAK